MPKVKKEQTAVIAYKGFSKDLSCRGHAFEIGQTYEVEGVVKACKNGFHACEYPLSVFDYYAPATSRFAMVELAGDLDVEGDKTAARKITILKELTHFEMIEAAIAYTMKRVTLEEGATASGARGAATASGTRGAATASGTRGAATASGYQGAATASGDQGAATASGDQGAATASGYQGAATASGTRGAATASGTRGAATASGDQGKARGADGCALFLVERNPYSGEILAVWAGIAGRDGIKADTYYTLVDGKPVEA